jgi:formamidopyrimidine-DNA glycosylase
MPEAPEVSYLTQKLNRELKGSVLSQIKIQRGRYTRHGVPNGYTNFVNTLPQKLVRVYNKGKALFFEFEDGWTMISKLGMTGWWVVDNEPPSREENIVFQFTNKQGTLEFFLKYIDPRNFGTLLLTEDRQVVMKELNALAPDLFDSSYKFVAFYQKVKELRPSKLEWKIEDLMMSQKEVISGVGNWMKSESLYEARVSPVREVGSLSRVEWERIFRAIKSVGKRTLRAYRQEKELKTQVYQQEVDPLGHLVETRQAKDGRTTFWVPELQK